MFVVKLFIFMMCLLTISDAFSFEDRLEAVRENRAEGLCLFDIPATGGAGGYTYSDWTTFMSSGQAKITKFTVRSGSAIDCFGLTYGDHDAACHGGGGGSLQTVALSSDEYITEINGRGADRVDRLTIVTNKDVYGPFGGNGGRDFKVGFNGKKLAFITGRSDQRLDNLHLHFFC